MCKSRITFFKITRKCRVHNCLDADCTYINTNIAPYLSLQPGKTTDPEDLTTSPHDRVMVVGVETIIVTITLNYTGGTHVGGLSSESKI